MVVRKLIFGALAAAALFAAAPAHADWYGPRDGWHEGWRERAWREEAREREIRAQEWRAREWRREHYRFAPPPYYGPRY